MNTIFVFSPCVIPCGSHASMVTRASPASCHTEREKDGEIRYHRTSIRRERWDATLRHKKTEWADVTEICPRDPADGSVSVKDDDSLWRRRPAPSPLPPKGSVTIWLGFPGI